MIKANYSPYIASKKTGIEIWFFVVVTSNYSLCLELEYET